MAHTTYRITALLASGTLAAGVALVGAPAALAEGADTPPAVLSAVEEAQWPEYRPTEMGWNISVAKFTLAELGYYEPGEVLDDRFDAEPVMDYQQDTDLKVTGLLDQRTWDFLQEDFGVVREGDEGYTVSAAQTALHEKFGYDLSGDGYETYAPDEGTFGPATEAAVTAFQEEAGIDADGEVGPVTFKALVVTQGQD